MDTYRWIYVRACTRRLRHDSICVCNGSDLKPGSNCPVWIWNLPTQKGLIWGLRRFRRAKSRFLNVSVPFLKFQNRTVWRPWIWAWWRVRRGAAKTRHTYCTCRCCYRYVWRIERLKVWMPGCMKPWLCGWWILWRGDDPIHTYKVHIHSYIYKV
jgi:hypothetical protein